MKNKPLPRHLAQFQVLLDCSSYDAYNWALLYYLISSYPDPSVHIGSKLTRREKEENVAAYWKYLIHEHKRVSKQVGLAFQVSSIIQPYTNFKKAYQAICPKNVISQSFSFNSLSFWFLYEAIFSITDISHRVFTLLVNIPRNIVSTWNSGGIKEDELPESTDEEIATELTVEMAFEHR